MLRIALVTVAFSCAGCSREEKATPVGCLDGDVRQALQSAPDRVSLDETPLSECLSDTTDGGELQEIGTAYVEAASDLADEATEDPESDAALQLGYLIGAVKRSEAGAQGVGYELGRRLATEAGRVPRGSRAYARGERAGTAGG